MNESGLCRYSVVRFTPDPVRDESVNIGVVLHEPGHGQIGCRFVSDFRRLRWLFPSANVESVKWIIEDWSVLARTEPLWDEAGIPTPALPIFGSKTPADFDFLDEVADRYRGSVTLTPPRGTVALDFDVEVIDLFSTFVDLVVEPPNIQPAIGLGRRAARKELIQKFELWGLVGRGRLTKDYGLQVTSLRKRSFDLGFDNRVPHVIQATPLTARRGEANLNSAFLFAGEVSGSRNVTGKDVQAHVVVHPRNGPDDGGFEESTAILRSEKIDVVSFDQLDELRNRVEMALRH